MDAAHNNIMNKAFWVEADVTAELRYADGSDTDLKLVMKPTDIDVVDGFGLKESFYINDYKNAVDKRLMNNANALNQTDQSGRTIWEATTSTSGAANENNISGLAVRSADNTLNFGYLSTEACSAVFGLYIEKVDPKPVLEVDPVKIPAKEGQEVTYKGTFKIPVPGKDILATPTTIEMTETFDERLDYKELKVEAGGNALQEGRDYTIEKKGQTVTVKMTPEYVKANSSQDIVITYKTATNQKVAEKGAATIENTVTLKVDNLSAPSNQVTTDLLYEKKHEFVSGTAGKELPQEIKDLTPETEKNLENGTKTTPTQPAKTEVQTADGTWTFKSYDKAEETINGADAHFVGTWDFTPNPTYKATHEFVSGTAGKELPQEVKSLLPSDKPDLADGTKATPTQPVKTEVQTADGTWTFKSYDKNEETINGADAHFVGTWTFAADSTTLTGSVIWIDNDNGAGRRAQSVLVHLLADGHDTGISVTVDEAMGWKYSFENLPRFKDGKEIVYSVREDEVEVYSNQAEGMNVTNRLLVDAQVKEIGKKRILPKTGQDTSIWMLILGFLTFGGAVGLTKRQRD